MLVYQGTAANPIKGVSSLLKNNNNGSYNVAAATWNGVSWTGTAKVVSLLLASWQQTNAAISLPDGYSLQGSATDSYDYVAVNANLTPQILTNLGTKTSTFSPAQSIIQTLQIAVQLAQ